MIVIENCDRSLAPPAPGLRGIPKMALVSGAIVFVNLALILAASQAPNLGWKPISLSGMLLAGVAFAEVTIAIFVMSFGHFRAPLRQLVCTAGLGALVEIWNVIAGAEMEAHAFSLLFAIGALWLGYALLLPLRVICRLEFGIPAQGKQLPPRSMQFQLGTLIWLGCIVAVACAILRLWMTVSKGVNSSKPFPVEQFFAPLVMLIGILSFTIPLFVVALRNQGSRIWLALASGWSLFAVGFLITSAPRETVAGVSGFSLTIVATVIAFRLLGVRWVQATPPVTLKVNELPVATNS